MNIKITTITRSMPLFLVLTAIHCYGDAQPKPATANIERHDAHYKITFKSEKSANYITILSGKQWTPEEIKTLEKIFNSTTSTYDIRPLELLLEQKKDTLQNNNDDDATKAFAALAIAGLGFSLIYVVSCIPKL